MSGQENLANAIRDYLLSETQLREPWHPVTSAPLGSPIEKLLYDAVILGCRVGASWFTPILEAPTTNTELQIKPQYVADDWPVDFAFWVISDTGTLSMLAVECDGHDFHERTKAQAARDRSRDRRLQDAGIAVYRFTGSEIYRDAFACARQIFAWAEAAAWKK